MRVSFNTFSILSFSCAMQAFYRIPALISLRASAGPLTPRTR